MSTDSETSTYDYSSDEEAHNYNMDDPFYRGQALPDMDSRPPATNNSMSPEQLGAWENISLRLSRGLRIRVDPE